MPGKVFSKKNLNSLKDIFMGAVSLLSEGGIDKAALLELIDGNPANSEVISASAFKESVAESTWFENNYTILDMFESNFYALGRWCDSTSTKEAIQTSLTTLVSDVRDLMLNQIEAMPDLNSGDEGCCYDMYCQSEAAAMAVAKLITAQSDELDDPGVLSSPNTPLQLNAESQSDRSEFASRYSIQIWREKIDAACCLFRSCLRKIAWSSKDVDACKAEARELLEEFIAVFPPVIEECPVFEKLQASVLEEVHSVPQTVQAEQKTQADSPTKDREKIVISCSLAPPSNESIQARADKADLNITPFTGVLFKVECISDGAPGTGPRSKLYVPRATAELCRDLINVSGGLPLDVKASLTGHDDENITGIMTSAAIVGSDFVVYGSLFPFNKPVETNVIKKHIDELGMSINAESISHPEVMFNPKTGANETVAVIDELFPLGANILFSRLATWQDTKVLQANGITPNSSEDEASPSSPVVPIVSGGESNVLPERETVTLAASAAPNQINQENNMNQPNPQNAPSFTLEDLKQEFGTLLETQKASFVQAQADSNSSIETQITQLLQIVQAQGNEIKELQQEKQQKEALVQAQKEQEQKEKNKAETREMFAYLIKEHVNPLGQPRSLTSLSYTPLAAGAGGSEELPPASKVERELIAAEATLKALNTTGHVGKERVEASDKVDRLRMQLQQARLQSA